MTEEIQRITVGEFDELIAFLDAAFGHETPDRSFVHLLPGLYRRQEVNCNHNYAIRVDGRLASVVGLFPIEWRVGDSVLRVAGVGGVSVGHDFRRTGLMTQLMAHVRGEIAAQGYHLSYLGGQRQRYRYFGWEMAGVTVIADVEHRNIRHAFGNAPAAVTLDKQPDAAALAALHDAQASSCRRGDFGAVLRHWFCRPIAARDASGRVVGYAVVNAERKRVHELVAVDGDTGVQIVRALLSGGEPWSVSVALQATQVELIRAISELAERVRIEHSGNWQVFDWPATVGALMRARHASSPLAPGEVALGADGRAFRMVVDGDGPRCEPFSGRAAVELDGTAMTRLLLGPLPPAAVVADAPAPLSAWCPLPLGFSTQDHV